MDTCDGLSKLDGPFKFIWESIAEEPVMPSAVVDWKKITLIY